MSNNPHHPHYPSGSGSDKATIAIAAVGATASGIAAAVALSKAVSPMTTSGYAKRSEKKLKEAAKLTYQKHDEGTDKYIIPETRRNALAQRIQPLQDRHAVLEAKTQSSLGSAMQWNESRSLYQDSKNVLKRVKKISNEEWLNFMMEQDAGSQDHSSGPSGHQQQTRNYYGPTSSSHPNEYSSMSTSPSGSLEIQEVRRGTSQDNFHSDYYGRPFSSASDSYDSHGRTSASTHNYPPSMPRDSEKREFSEFSQPRNSSIRSHGRSSYNAQNPPLGDREQTQISESYPQSHSASDLYYERRGQTSSVQVYSRREIVEHDRASKASSGSGGSEYYSTVSYRSNPSEYNSARSHISTNSNVSSHSSSSQHTSSQRSSTTNFHQYPANNYQGPGPSYNYNTQNYGAYYNQGQVPANVQHSTYSNASQSSSASKKSRSAAAKKQ